MAKERLSKLQKWILSHCVEKGFIWRNDAREFYGKKFSPSGRIVGYTFPPVENKESLSSKAEEVSISKSFRNIERKGLITRDEKWDGVPRWELTEKGFLKANEWEQMYPFISFKDYCIGVEKKKKEQKKWLLLQVK